MASQDLIEQIASSQSMIFNLKNQNSTVRKSEDRVRNFDRTEVSKAEDYTETLAYSPSHVDFDLNT